MKNLYEIRGEVTAIYLKSKKHGDMETLIDTVDLPLVDSFPNSWVVTYENRFKKFYVVGQMKNKNIISRFTLHRWIMGNPSGLVVDHIDHDTLNNKRTSNLRRVTNSQNMQNRSGLDKNNTTGARNVFKDKGRNKWRVRIVVSGKTKNFGSYETFEEAERVASRKRMELGFLHSGKDEAIGS